MPARPAIAVLFLAAVVASAQDPIRFARTPDISPDGKTVAFSYLGDIWTVEAIGGVARPVTLHEAHDYCPCFSPDGRRIAFSSNRHGSYDVFVVPVQGGRPKRLTFDSAHDIVTGWTPDGKSVVFSSTRSPGYPPTQDVYTVPADGGPEVRVKLFDGKEAYFSPAGDKLAFVKGPGLWYRKGYRGSSSDDIWLANADGTNPQQLTTFPGQDSSPMWAPDGKTLYYVSETAATPGVGNVVSRSLAPAGEAVALTKHATDFVRRARVSGNGQWIVYECGADLWVVSTAGGEPRRLAIEAHADDKSNADRVTTFTRDATAYALSPDESHAVIVVHGELFLTKVPAGGKATRLTDSPADDHSPAWSPDGKFLLYVSDRSGTDEIYKLEPDDTEHPEFEQAHKFKTTRLTTNPDAASGVSFAPKGERVAFLRAGKLWTMKPDGTDVKVLVDDAQVFDYDWSPDGKYVAYARVDGSFASEIYIVPTDGKEPPRNVTRYATWNADVNWSVTNGKISFVSQRRGGYAMHVLSLHRPTADGSSVPKSAEIEWDDIHLRVERPTWMPADGGSISPDGSQVAFRSLSNGDDLWAVATDGRTMSRLTTGNQSPRQIRWARKSAGTVYFLNGSGELRMARTGALAAAFGANPADPQKVPFSCPMTINRDDEFSEMFAQCWQSLSDTFYDPAYHGADWQAVRAKYAPLVSHVTQKEDLYALISLMLGELNASHLGIGGRTRSPYKQTADLGILFDETYRGPGLKVAEILKRGPADRRNLKLAAGDVILAVDRVELSGKWNLSEILNDKAGEPVRLDVTSNPADLRARRKLEVTPANRGTIAELMYDRWTAANATQVERQSNGRLAYIHIPAMNEDGLEKFVRALHSDTTGKDGLVIDVRFNGGGFTHDQVINYLTGKDHTTFRTRHGGEGLVLRSGDRKWSKPLTVLINSQSYSDAEIFPHAVRSHGLGKIVGEATGGNVIGTGGTTLIDGSTFRQPRIGVYTNAGVNMEREGVKPDVPVLQSASDWAAGYDTQLGTAVKVLSADVAAWRKTKGLTPWATATVAPMPRPAAGERPGDKVTR